jgi:hypothetical protein
MEESEDHAFDENIEYQNVDQIVVEGLSSMANGDTNSSYNYEKLIDIYNKLEIE